MNRDELIAALEEQIALMQQVKELLSGEVAPKPKRKYRPRGEKGAKG